MKKLLSILLTASMVGAPIISSNCFALTVPAMKNDKQVSTKKVNESKVKEKWFKLVAKKIFNNKNGLAEQSYEAIKQNNENKLEELKNIIKKIGVEFDTDEEFNEFKEFYVKVYEKKHPEVEASKLETEEKPEIVKEEKEVKVKEENIVNPEVKSTENKNEVEKEKTEIVKENSEIKKENIEDKKETEKKAIIVIDKEKTKKKSSPVFKIIIGGTVVAIVTYAGLVAYDMYQNDTTYKEANQKLWGSISNYTNYAYNCSIEYAKGLADYAKSGMNTLYDYFTSSNQTAINNTLNYENTTLAEPETIINESVAEPINSTINNAANNSTVNNTSSDSAIGKIGVAAATVASVAKSAMNVIANHPTVSGLIAAAITAYFTIVVGV